MPPPLQSAYKRIAQPKVGENGYEGFQPGKTEIFEKGSNKFNAKPLSADLLLEHDVEIVVRDGCRLYADIYRPAHSTEKIPAILSWSPYGKAYSSLSMLPVCVWNCCVPREDLSGHEKFEGLDPERWCQRGYALVHVDTRGAGNSDGQICVIGTQEAEDGYDVVEAVAKMDWCNGNVGMAGNSYLAITQWFIAAQQPPSLKAIAPWEGMGDLFREQFCRGGWFSMSNFDLITKVILRGKENSGVEDFAEMYRRSGGVISPFWADKRVDMTKIRCPAYIRGSDVSTIHTMGAIRSWIELPHENKWLHWSSRQEWYELYSEPESLDELEVFFDRYLREVDNGWEKKTPKVRWAALQFGDREAIHDIELKDFPVPNTEYREFFLSDKQSLSTDRQLNISGTSSYNSEDFASFAEFDYKFEKATRMIGLPKAILYMSCPDADDMVVFVIVRKKDKNGKVLMHLNFPFHATPVNSIDEIKKEEQATLNLHLGSLGILRASQRAIDHSRSIHPQFPFHPHTKQEKIAPGTVVKLEIGIWAMGVDYDAGESLCIRVSGQVPGPQEFKSFSEPRPEHERNHGRHMIHYGGQYPSRVILPII